jgi:hypothetical protein
MSAFRLLEEINLDDADTARVVLSAHLRRVLAGLDRGNQRRFKIRDGCRPVLSSSCCWLVFQSSFSRTTAPFWSLSCRVVSGSALPP